jgi:DNA-binding CsgD family transcriptional regulator
MTAAGATRDAAALEHFTRFLDAIYPAALGEMPWSAALGALLLLGRGQGTHCRALYETALRHVRHALAISQRLGVDARRAAVLECAAGSLPCGLLLLDARADVLFASERAHSLLRGHVGAAFESGRLRSVRGLDEALLLRTLPRLLSKDVPEPGTLCLQVPAQGRHGPVRLLLMRAAGDAAHSAVLALVFEQLARRAPPGTALLRDVYGFSPAEARLAGLLLAGQSLGEAARTRSVSMNTARSQLKVVLRKTGCRNQADLMRTLIAGPVGLMQGLLPPAGARARASARRPDDG